MGATKETGPTQQTNGRGNGTKYGTGRIDRVEAAHKIAQNVFKGRRWKEKKGRIAVLLFLIVIQTYRLFPRVGRNSTVIIWNFVSENMKGLSIEKG
jgi:hypothetical protein